MVGRIIETEADIAEGVAWLCEVEPRFAQALQISGPIPLRRRVDGFEALLDAIVSQQLSVAAADTIWGRLEAGGWTTPETVISAEEDTLRACGLSRPKIRYAKELATSGLNYTALRSAPSDEVIERLTAIKGIGIWTAEIYAMFSLGRADVFAPGDLALQESAKILFELTERPKEKEFRVMANAWSPWRAVAARMLWAYYRAVKQREGTR